MGLKKEPIEVDFIVDSRPLTKKEDVAISEFIKADKEKRSSRPKQTHKKIARKKVEEQDTLMTPSGAGLANVLSPPKGVGAYPRGPSGWFVTS
jgi:hypothetical protein